MRIKYLISIVLVFSALFTISTKSYAKYIKEKTLQIATVNIKMEHTYTVTINYINKKNNTIIESTKIEKLKSGIEYKTEKKEISNFYLESDSGNTIGIINNENIEVNYYYKPYGVFAKIYDTTNDGKGDTLVLNSTPFFTYNGTLINDFNNQDNNEYQQTSSKNAPIWYSLIPKIEKVEILNGIRPKGYTTRWFELGSNIIQITNLSNIDTSRITSMEFMFKGCEKIETLDLSSFNTDNVRNMRGVFYDCKNLNNLNISNLNTKNVTTMKLMFSNCRNLESIDVSQFDTRNVNNMESMFFNCRSLEQINLINFNTTKVTTMNSMFTQCNKIKTLDLSSFNTKKVTDMYGMFYYCEGIETIYIGSDWETSKVTKSNYMFMGDNNLVGSMGTTYDESIIDKTYACPDKGELSPGYLTLKNSI